jgi:hypothetical protein
VACPSLLCDAGDAKDEIARIIDALPRVGRAVSIAAAPPVVPPPLTRTDSEWAQDDEYTYEDNDDDDGAGAGAGAGASAGAGAGASAGAGDGPVDVLVDVEARPLSASAVALHSDSVPTMPPTSLRLTKQVSHVVLEPEQLVHERLRLVDEVASVLAVRSLLPPGVSNWCSLTHTHATSPTTHTPLHPFPFLPFFLPSFLPFC